MTIPHSLSARGSRLRRRVAEAAGVALRGWGSCISVTTAVAACCGVLTGAVLGALASLSQSSTLLGRVLLGIFDALVGGVAGGMLGATGGGLFAIVGGMLGIPVIFSLAVVAGPSPSARKELPSAGTTEVIPANTPHGRGDETLPGG